MSSMDTLAGRSIESTFDKVYLTYYSRMRRFAKEYVLFDEDAENIVQDVFLLLWEKREVLDIQLSMSSWLFSLVKNKSLDYLRHKTVEEEYKQEFMIKVYSLDSMNYTFSSDEDLEQVLVAAINKLPERCREIFLKSRMEGKKYREIAEEMNLSVNTIESQMSIALKKLRCELKEYLPLLLFLLNVK